MSAMIEVDGKNGAALREWVAEHFDVPDTERWFLTRGMTASTGNQAWRYAADGQQWKSDVVAAVYHAPSDTWHPLRVGDRLRAEGGVLVLRPA